jgi:hypothetical protein
MPPVGFESTISAGERPQTYALDRAATETGSLLTLVSVGIEGILEKVEFLCITVKNRASYI